MKKVNVFTGMLAAVVALGAWSYGQDRERPVREGIGDRGSSVDIAPNRENIGTGGRGGGGFDSPAPRVDVPSVPRTDPGGRGGAGGGGNTIPIQTYTPNYTINRWGWYYCDRFLYLLWNQYRFYGYQQHLWRYAQGDSPLTKEVLEMAVRDSSYAAAQLVNLTEDLGRMLDDYEAQRMDRKTFQAGFDDTLGQIRKSAKKIRTDYYLEYLDQRVEEKAGVLPGTVASVAQLRGLVDQLHEMALQTQRGIVALYKDDLSRVISVEYLNQPSFKSLSQSIDKLSKTIEKSAERL